MVKVNFTFEQGERITTFSLAFNSVDEALTHGAIMLGVPCDSIVADVYDGDDWVTTLKKKA